MFICQLSLIKCFDVFSLSFLHKWNIFFSIGRLHVCMPMLLMILRFDNTAVVRHVGRGVGKVDSICKVPLLSILLPSPPMKIPVLSRCQVLENTLGMGFKNWFSQLHDMGAEMRMMKPLLMMEVTTCPMMTQNVGCEDWTPWSHGF